METEGVDRTYLTAKLLQPHCFSEVQLKDILLSRCVEVGSDTSKEKLLELYSRIVLPLPQRETTSSVRGNKKIKNKRQPIQMSLNGKSNERLKPPPSTEKRIKLSKSSENLRKIVINNRNSVDQKPDNEKTLTRMIPDSPLAKKITLKRDFTEQGPAETTKTNTPKADSQKRIKITWP